MKSEHAPCEGEGKMSTNKALSSGRPTVDGRNRANQLRLVVFPHYLRRVSYIPSGAGFLNHPPSTVCIRLLKGGCLSSDI